MPDLSKPPRPFRIATRGSALALVQASIVLDACRRHFPGETFELCIIRTTGDRDQRTSLQRFAPAVSLGLFTRELETALLEERADIAVHSLKDLPTRQPEGLRIGAVLPREDVRDVLITRVNLRKEKGGQPLRALSAGAVIATSSPRRAAQLRWHRPDLQWKEIRGNVPTRLQKLARGTDFDGTLLAAAGLARLGIRINSSGQLMAPAEIAPDGWGHPLFATFLPPSAVLPAPGQAAIAVECRLGDRRATRICRLLDDPATHACVVAERTFLAATGGGCHSAVGALGRIKDDQLHLQAVAFEGDKVWRDTAVGPVHRPAALGTMLGRRARKALRAS